MIGDKCFILLTIIFTIDQFVFGYGSELQCTYDLPNVPNGWVVMSPECIQSVTELINLKLSNSVQYLALGAFYKRDSVNRLGTADIFYEHADKSRDNAIELIDYVLMRGKYTSANNILQLEYRPLNTEWYSLTDGINEALNLEAVATNKYHDTIEICEQYGVEDYNIANWLARYFLHDQYDEQKWFADLSSSLKKMEELHQNLGEFFLDWELSENS